MATPGNTKKIFAKVVVIGDSGVGKTSLIQVFENNKFNQMFKPTIGADFSNKELVMGDRMVTLQIWDTAGQERFQSLGSAFYRGADCCVLVYDITNAQSFGSLLNWKASFMTKSDPREPETLPFLCIGNKIDEEGSRKVSKVEATRFCEENGFIFEETSAKDNLNIEAGFRALVGKVIERQERFNSKTVSDMSVTTQSRQEAIASNSNKRTGRATVKKLGAPVDSAAKKS